LLDAECVVEQVDDTVDTLEEVVSDPTDTVEGVVDDRVGDEPPEEPAGGDGDGDNDDDEGSGRVDKGDGRDTGDPTSGRGGVRGSSPSSTATPKRGTPTPWVTAPPVGAGPARMSSPDVGALGQAIVHTATGVGVMLFLLGLVAAFVTLQHALDRRDPKLAPETLGSDRVPFA
jgi:hypothetical protein